MNADRACRQKEWNQPFISLGTKWIIKNSWRILWDKQGQMKRFQTLERFETCIVFGENGETSGAVTHRLDGGGDVSALWWGWDGCSSGQDGGHIPASLNTDADKNGTKDGENANTLTFHRHPRYLDEQGAGSFCVHRAPKTIVRIYTRTWITDLSSFTSTFHWKGSLERALSRAVGT